MTRDYLGSWEHILVAIAINCRGVVTVERFKQESMYGQFVELRKSGHCGEVAI